MTPIELPYETRISAANGVEIEHAVAGSEDGPLVILLHGFPDLWQGWHLQIPPLADAGYRLLVPNQRGYGRSGRPEGISSYDLDLLAQDVIVLADAAGRVRFSLVGHDWGGIVAWWTASRFPERIERLMILNAPHPLAFKEYVCRSPSQMLKSWYAAAFQLPLLPEAILSARKYALLFRSVQGTSRPGIFDDSDRRYLTEGWSQPGALTAMLNYYRAFAHRSSSSLRLRVSVPTLILWGTTDPTEELGLAEASLALCHDARIEPFVQARHWLQREEPERVNQAIVSFLDDA